MDSRTLDSLEVESLRALLARHVQTPLGRALALALAPSTSLDEIELAQQRTGECLDYLSSGEKFSLGGIEDPTAIIERLQVEGTCLDPVEILRLERLLAAAMDLRLLFRDAESRERYPRLHERTAQIPDLRSTVAEIKGRILPGGEIADDASPELRSIRRQMQISRQRIHRHLESILQSEPHAVQEEIVTFRNGRFVIPIRIDARGQVPGVVHGLSSSGQTLFVEPLPVIAQNNDLVRLKEEEEAEIARILNRITGLLRKQVHEVRRVAEAVAEIDFSQAKARFAAEFQCVRPSLNPESRLVLREARHLLLEHNLRQAGEPVVPVSLDLDRSRSVLVISGSNAGGKTVVLKTVGLISLMAQMGLHVPVLEADLPVFSRIIADIGDQQSIAANLSTFTAHMRNISEMAEQTASSPALVLIDEVGTGTDPDEGTALAVAIVDFFRTKGATTIATTHYNGLKVWASRTPGVRNASVEFDERTLRPTYRLILDVAGASSGLEIARRMRVPETILQNAARHLDPSHLQAADYLKRLKAGLEEQAGLKQVLEEQRAALVEKGEKLDLEFAQREEERQKIFERERDSILAEFQAESDRLIRSLQDRAEARRLKKDAAARAARLRHMSHKLSPEPGASGADAAPEAQDAGTPLSVREGDRVRVKALDQDGVVDSIEEDTYTVRIGALKYRADPGELERISSEEAPTPSPQGGVTIVDSETDREFVAELKVIGMTADEATESVDKFLDQALLAGAESVRIIHGYGKGILRRAIAAFLSDHPQVARFQLAPPDQGGGGATIVELRR